MKKAIRSMNALVIGGGSTLSALLAMNEPGMRSNKIACLACDAAFTIALRKNLLVVEDRGIEQMILPVPKRVFKGILKTSILSGVGSNAEGVNNKGDLATTGAGLQTKRDSLRNLLPVVAREPEEGSASL
jgi:hypothetical protein